MKTLPRRLDIRLSLLACLSPLAAGCVTSSTASPPSEAGPPTDPTRGEVLLPGASGGWRASLVLDNGATGVWTVAARDFFPQYGAPEVIGLDDLGRCHVLVSYSGKWTPVTRVHDGKWLGGLAHADVDPRVEGKELYVGSQSGNLYQLLPTSDGRVDDRLIARFPGRELHTIVAGELDPRRPGPELLVFTNPGELWRVAPEGEHGGFALELLEVLDGRVRDALVLPREDGSPPEIATVSRAGKLELLSFGADGIRRELVHAESMGMGRLAQKPARAGEALVLYATLDDGRVYRHERGATGWRNELVYAGPQGPRGIAAGRFDSDPAAETVAVFGYSTEVELLTRRSGRWEVETIFVDRDKGHWIAAAELDGRNTTDELVSAGYSGRIVLLSRPPGHGLEGVPAVAD